jgi:glutathione S-transferase
MYKIYCRKGAGSVAVEAMLAQCGAIYAVHDLERNPDGTFPDFFHRINPRAEVPTLMLPDDSIMTESAAMLIHLADTHPDARLSPAIWSPKRPRFLRWMLYLATTLYMSDLRMFYPERYTIGDEGVAAIKAKAIAGMASEFKIYADALGQGPFILGSEMSAADIYAAMLATWVPDMSALFAKHPNLEAMYKAVIAQPAIAAVWGRNGI